VPIRSLHSQAAMQAFHAEHVREDGLMPVGNFHTEARLWPNTELAAWLQFDPTDFL